MGGEKETCQGKKKPPYSRVFKGSCQLFFYLQNPNGKWKMCQTILFDLFLVVQMCKELNRLEHMLYLGGWGVK